MLNKEQSGASPAVANQSPTAFLPTRHGLMHVWTCPPAVSSDAAAIRPTVVLVHGMFGDIESWAPTMAALQRHGLGILVPDLPGHGKTPSDVATVEEIVESVLELLQQQSSGPLALVGHSFGAAVAVRCAAQLPTRLHSVTLLAPAGLGSKIDESFLVGMLEADTEAALAQQLARLSTIAPELPADFLSEFKARLQQRASTLKTLCRRLNRDGMQLLDISDELAGLGCPVTIIHGRNDSIIPWQHALNAPEHAALHLLPHIGHVPHWEAPELIESILVNVLRD